VFLTQRRKDAKKSKCLCVFAPLREKVSSGLLVIDSSLDHSLYAGGHVRKEIEARDRLDLIALTAVYITVGARFE
jgi:hypothetical protein